MWNIFLTFWLGYKCSVGCISLLITVCVVLKNWTSVVYVVWISKTVIWIWLGSPSTVITWHSIQNMAKEAFRLQSCCTWGRTTPNKISVAHKSQIDFILCKHESVWDIVPFCVGQSNMSQCTQPLLWWCAVKSDFLPIWKFHITPAE